MGIFTPDFAKVEASIPVFDKARYQVQVSKATPFSDESKNEETGIVSTNAGVRYGLEMRGMFNGTGELVTLDYKGRTVSPYKVWLHTEGGWKYAKPFIMACFGFKVKDEQAANEAFQKLDWTFKGEVGYTAEQFTLGTAWNTLLGKIVDVNLWKKTTVKDGVTYENQEFGGWTPVGG